MLKLLKKKEIIFFFILFITLFIFTYVQVNSQHWSSIFYFDLTIIYNSLSVVSGYYQEYRTHPAYTQFLVNGLFYKFLSLFDNNVVSNLDSYIASTNKDLTIQTLYVYSRYIHSLFYFLFAIYFFKLANYFKVNNYYTFVSIILLFLSERILYDSTVLRADILSYLLFLISTYYFLIYFDLIKIKYLIISCFCLTLTLLAKIQIIFYLPLIYIFLIFKLLKIDDFKINKFNFPFNFKIKIYVFLLFFLGISYLALQVLLNQHSRFVDSNYLDLKLFLFSTLILIFLTKFTFNKLKEKKKLFITISFYIFFFIFLTILALNLLSLIGVVKLSPYILLRLTNPFHYMTIVSYDDVAKKLVDTQILILMIKKFFSFSNLNFKLSLILILNLAYVFIFFENFRKNKDALILYTLILFFFYFILLTFNFRYYETYILYSLSIYIFIFMIYLSNMKNLVFKSLLLIAMVTFIFVPHSKSSLNTVFSVDNFKKNYFKREDQSIMVCTSKKNRFMYWWWARKQNENFWLDFCNKRNIKLMETEVKINNIY